LVDPQLRQRRQRICVFWMRGKIVVENLRRSLFLMLGLQVVRATRTGSGVVIRNGEQNDDKFDWVVTDDQNPQKARILTALALTRTNDSKELQKILWKY